MPRPSRYVQGAQHGRLTLLVREGKDRVLCRCVCGTEKSILLGHVIHNKTQSCGCLHKEIVSKMMTTRQTTHGYFGTAVYAIWIGMHQRCDNPNHHAFKDYGGRGIKVCKRWSKFENFLADMGEPEKGLTLERLKNHLGYSPRNCAWATSKEQGNNRRSCVTITYAGQNLNVTQWAEKLNINRDLIYGRLRAGWSPVRALSTTKRGTTCTSS